MMETLPPFDEAFGELRSLVAEGLGERVMTVQYRLGKILSVIWPWRDDARYAEQLVPYVLDSFKSWDMEYLDVPARRWDYVRPYQSPILLSIRDAYLRGEPDPLWPLFTRLKVSLSRFTAEDDASDEGDQHALQGEVRLPENAALVALDIITNTVAPDDVVIASLNHVFSSPTLELLADIRWTNWTHHPEFTEPFLTLCDNEVITRLKRLEFYDVPLGVEGIKRLVTIDRWKALKYIFFTSHEVERGCDINDEAFEILARSPLFAQLDVLDVSWNDEITERTAHMLIEHVDPKTAPRLDFDCTSFKWNDGDDLLWDAGWYDED